MYQKCITNSPCTHLENRFKIENQFHQLDGTNLNSFRSHIDSFTTRKKWFGLLVIIFPKNMHYLCIEAESMAKKRTCSQ